MRTLPVIFTGECAILAGEAVGAIASSPEHPAGVFPQVFYFSLGVVILTALCGLFYDMGKRS